MAASKGSGLPQDWDIGKSAFLPPANRRAVHAWDRAKVPARAPRLHGKKVWKKLVRAIGTDGNLEEVQLELQKDGSGARKKLRTAGAKQNIRDAEWDGSEWEGFPDDVVSTAAQSTQTADDEGSVEDDLKFVPRKRRNNNKVVSPKKSLRQTTLNMQGQNETLQISPEDAIKRATRPRKSLRKSLRRSMLITTESSSTSPGTEQPTVMAEFNMSAEASMLEVFSPVIRSPLKSPRKKQRLHDAETTREGDNLRLSGAFFAGADAEFPATNEGHAADNADIQGTPVRFAKALAVPATAPPKVHLSKSELELQMVNFFTPIAKMKKTKRRSSPIKSYLQELLEKKALPLEPLEQEVEDQLNSGDDHNSTASGDAERDQEEDPEICAEAIASDGNFQSSDDAQEAPSPHKEDITSPTDTASEEHETESIAGEDTPQGPELASPDHSSPTQSNEPVFEHTEDATHSDSTSTSSSSSTDSHENASSTPPNAITTVPTYDHDDTDMLRSFLTRVQASKANKVSPKRKRSLPHSPLRIPLGDMDSNLSPSPVKPALLENEDPTSSSPVKRSKRLKMHADEEPTEPQSCRRSGRTRLPVKSSIAPPGAPSFIPVRRLGQDEPTVTLGKNESKELAALTRVNTRKNKAGALSAQEMLVKKAEEKEDPILRQRLLKEVFDEKGRKGEKKGKGRGVTWAEELTSIREFDEKKIICKSTSAVGGAGTKGGKKGKGAKSVTIEESEVQEDEKDKTTRVKVGMASTRESKIALGMGVNGTPAPKRRLREPRVKA